MRKLYPQNFRRERPARPVAIPHYKAAAMGKDAVPSLQNLERPEDLKALLKQDAGDDCMSCRLIGKIHLHLDRPHPPPGVVNSLSSLPRSHDVRLKPRRKPPGLTNGLSCRQRRLPRPLRVQLLLGHVAAGEAAGRGPQERVDVRHAEQEGGHRGTVAGACLDGHLEADEVTRKWI